MVERTPDQQGSHVSFSDRLSNPRILAALVFVASVLLYLPSVANGFAYDDHVIIRLDDRIRDLSVTRIFTQPYWRDPDLGLYRPLASLSFAVDWAISGGNPHWFHFMNTLWNACAVTLVFLFLATLAPAFPALAGALVFAVHPVHVEAVANIVGRAEVMAAAFSIAALLVWSRSAPDAPRSRRSAIAVVLLYVLAILSKESAIMLPALLALCDVARGVLTPRTVAAWFRLHARSLTALAVTAAVYLLVRSAVTGGIGPSAVDPALDIASSASTRILTALQAWPFILRVLLVPRVLLSDYGPGILLPALGLTPLATAGALILGGFITGGVVAWTRGQGRLAAALLFLPVTLLPTSNLLVPIGVIVAERTLYLPSLAIAMGVAFAGCALSGRAVPLRVPAVAVSVVVLLFSARSLDRMPEWRSTESIFAALRRDRPDSFRAQWHFARIAVNDSAPHLALQRYADMMRIWPYRRRAVLEAAAYAAQVGDLAFTESLTAFAVERWPDDVEFLRIRAGVQLDLGHTAAAAATIAHALQLAPADPLLLAMHRALADGALK